MELSRIHLSCPSLRLFGSSRGLFPASEQEGVASSNFEEASEDPKSSLKRSLSCPELVSIEEDELPALEKMPVADVEEQKAEDPTKDCKKQSVCFLIWLLTKSYQP